MDTIRDDKQSNLDFIVVIVVSVVAAALVALLEYGTGGGWLPKQFYLVYAGICSVILVPLIVWRFRIGKLVVYITLLIVLYAICVIPLTTRQVFLRDFGKTRPGMTVSQVEIMMKPCARYSKQPWMGDLNSPDQRAYRPSGDADFGIVRFRDGKVTETEFLAD